MRAGFHIFLGGVILALFIGVILIILMYTGSVKKIDATHSSIMHISSVQDKSLLVNIFNSYIDVDGEGVPAHYALSQCLITKAELAKAYEICTQCCGCTSDCKPDCDPETDCSGTGCDTGSNDYIDCLDGCVAAVSEGTIPCNAVEGLLNRAYGADSYLCKVTSAGGSATIGNSSRAKISDNLMLYSTNITVGRIGVDLYK